MEKPRAPGTGRHCLKAGGAAFPLAAVALHLLLYAPSLSGLFTFDDHKIVVEDAAVTGREALASVFSRPYFASAGSAGAVAYRPVALFSLGIDARLFGLSPFAMRLGNVVWAGIGAGLFALLAARLGASTAVSWSVLVLLSAHPVRSDAIVCVVGRSELLAFALVVAGLLLARASWGAPDVSRRTGLAAASGAALLLALLSKETAFAAPALLLLVWLADSSGERRTGRGRAPTAVLLGWGCTLAAAFVLRRAILGGFLKGPAVSHDALENALAVLPAVDRVFASVALFPRAAGLLLWPKTLVADYGSRALPVGSLLTQLAVTAGVATAVAALVLGLGLRRAAPLASLGLAGAAISYLPFANLAFPTGVLFTERLLYAPSAGAVLAVVAGLFSLSSWRGTSAARSAAVLAVAALALLGAARLESRLPEWRDDRTLFQAAVRDLPGNGRAWINLAVLALSDGDAVGAERSLRAALRADPELRGFVESMRDHARALGRPELVAAIDAALASPR